MHIATATFFCYWDCKEAWFQPGVRPWRNGPYSLPSFLAGPNLLRKSRTKHRQGIGYIIHSFCPVFTGAEIPMLVYVLCILTHCTQAAEWLEHDLCVNLPQHFRTELTRRFEAYEIGSSKSSFPVGFNNWIGLLAMFWLGLKRDCY